MAVIRLGLGVPEKHRNSPWIRRYFNEEIESLCLALEAEGIKYSRLKRPEERENESPNFTAFFIAEAPLKRLKPLIFCLKKTHPLGRLFNIAITEDTECSLNVPEGGNDDAPEIMENWLRQKLGDIITSAALWAIMSEAAVTPKPGLVDRANSGAHRDMDFFLFIDSATALLSWFRLCVLTGFDSGTGRELSSDDGTPGSAPIDLFESLRLRGRIAEVIMKKATGGINTHRGYIFTLGILSAAYGALYRNNEKIKLDDVLDLVKAMTKNLADDFSGASGDLCRALSHGEAVYERNGLQGIRGEVSRGFPAITEHALPLLRRLLKEGFSLNDAGIAVLLNIMAHAEDTNIIYRGGTEALKAVREELLSFFAAEARMGASGEKQGCLPAIEAIREKAVQLDRDLIARNLSPGGSADLLGITFFLYRLFDQSGQE